MSYESGDAMGGHEEKSGKTRNFRKKIQFCYLLVSGQKVADIANQLMASFHRPNAPDEP